ncbi:uncharacterized protein [Canis lupus baileyi]|uniref:uncharacterized protein n=1 Tax=Canis lupus baileyi TaxID=143281 RepID=UPI003B9769FF
MEYILFVLYFSFFLCLCALVCLYFSGCQEMTYKHEGKRLALGVGGPEKGCTVPNWKASSCTSSCQEGHDTRGTGSKGARRCHCHHRDVMVTHCSLEII